MSYNVAASDITAEVAGLVFGSTTTPTSTQVAAWITTAEAQISAHVRSLGVDPDALQAATTDEGYYIARRWVILDVATRALRSRDRNAGELYRSLKSEAETLWNMLAERPANLGENQPTGAAAPNLVWQPRDTSGATWSSPGASYINNGRGRL